ncbi:MAG: aldo/keto reductase [Myxococcota bacterium]|nr:aldo/keto reductase [Myxococcota bacterium]
MGIRPRAVLLVCLALAAGIGFTVIGGLGARTAIGLAPSGFPAGPWLQDTFAPEFPRTIAGAVWMGATLLAILVGTFVAMRAAVRSRTDAARRGFLTGALSGGAAAVAAAAAGGAAAFARAGLGVGNGGRGWLEVSRHISGPSPQTHESWPEAWKGARVRSYRRLGRTGFEVSDISLGASRLQGELGERLVRQAIERGVNYLDTAPDYSETGSENAIGRGIRGQRDRLFLATKFCTGKGHLPVGTPVARYQEVIDESLRRLGTDYVDLAHVHSCDEVDRLLDPNLHEAFDRLREAGKVRFLGFSTHTPNLIQVTDAAVGSGRFDVMMLAYHHGIWPTIGAAIERARAEQDMGVVAMKTLKGAKHHGLAGFQEERDAYSQAAFKWVLSNPEVSCLVISFRELQHVDEYLYASGRSLDARDRAVLRRYDEAIAGSYCPPHCGACLSACPESLPIHDVLRHRMYFEDYGWEKHGMEAYARLERDAAVCAGCAAPCAGACPVGVAIPERMRGAHELLTLSG